MRLSLIPCSLREASAFVRRHHRHHQPPRGCLFSLAAAESDRVCGVIVVGRPVSRVLQAEPYTAEVTRCCTDGTEHACSFLYSAAWRAAQRLGYRRLITYTLPQEGGASLRGAGWRCVGSAGGGRWSRKDRPRVDEHPTQEKLRWEKAVAS